MTLDFVSRPVAQSSHHLTVVTRALEIFAGLNLNQRQARSRQYLHVMNSRHIVVS